MLVFLVMSILLVFMPNVAADFTPGEVYRESSYSIYLSDSWRVTDPTPDHDDAYNHLPNPEFGPGEAYDGIDIYNPSGATRAEVVIDRWGGHRGTSDKQLRFNNHDWIDIPEFDNTPGQPECYYSQSTVTVDVPVGDLVSGENRFEGLAGDQLWCDPFGWGQWGWYGIVVRTYFNHGDVTGEPSGSITSPSPGSSFTDNPTFTVSASAPSGIEQVDLFAYYEGMDVDGDGIFQEYQHRYSRPTRDNSMPFGLYEHVGTDSTSPYEFSWDTTWVPDQAAGSVKLIARIKATNGLWYVTNEVQGLTLLRPDHSIQMYKPENVPEVFGVRADAVKTSTVNVPADHDLSKATDARVYTRTWHGIDDYVDGGIQTDSEITINGYEFLFAGENHYFGTSLQTIPPSALTNGDNTFRATSDSDAHSIEILWPGPTLLVRYSDSMNPGTSMEFDHYQIDNPNDDAGTEYQQTSCLVFDVDGDNYKDIVVGARIDTPSLVWFKNEPGVDPDSWQRYMIESSSLHTGRGGIEAGGAFYDIDVDADGDLDIVMGQDWSGNVIWWWENPADPTSGDWTRRIIKNSGGNQHHDQIIGDFDDDGTDELVFWNQGDRSLKMVDIPSNPASTQPWPGITTIFTSPVVTNGYEGLAKADIDGDGVDDIIGAGRWFEHTGGASFTEHVIDSRSERHYVRAAAGDLKEGNGRPEVVFVPGDADGDLVWYECTGTDCNQESDWVKHTIEYVEHGHTLAVVDINNDGNMDIFVAEMSLSAANPRTMFFLGDGNGNFDDGNEIGRAHV